MIVKVASVGKDRSGLFLPAVDEYAGRLQHYCRFSLVEKSPSSHTGQRARDEEGERLLALKQPRDWLVALDERGLSWSSPELAGFLGKAQQAGADLLFVVGGDEGLSSAVREKAQVTLALSKMTLPHRLARVVLLEQVYRAFTLLRGEPYHK